MSLIVARPPADRRRQPPPEGRPRIDWRTEALLATLTTSDLDLLHCLGAAGDSGMVLHDAGDGPALHRLTALDVADPAALVSFRAQLVELRGGRARLTALGLSVMAAVARG